MIKTIIFDNNGVLTTCDDNKTIPDMAQYLGIEVEDLRTVFHREVVPADLGNISTTEFLYKLAKVIKKPGCQDELYRILQKSYEPLPGIPDLLTDLKKSHEIALMTNFIDCFDKLNKDVWHYDKIFDSDKIFVSSKLGLSKPDPEFYRYVLKRLDKKPNETVFIDDRSSNLLPAEKIEMNTILFTGLKSLRPELDNLLK